ncbi:hypothetical protein ACWNYH_00455 [Candidatus Vidania fulgoroideorum]
MKLSSLRNKKIKKKKEKLLNLSTKIFKNDLKNKIKMVKKWVEKGTLVFITIKQRGREIEKKDLLILFKDKLIKKLISFSEVKEKESKANGVVILEVNKNEKNKN